MTMTDDDDDHDDGADSDDNDCLPNKIYRLVIADELKKKTLFV